MRLKIDLHIHSIYSDGFGGVGEIIETASSKGLDGLAITDHDTLEGYHEAFKLKGGLLVIPGFEVATDAGHVLVLGLDRIPTETRKMRYEELIDWARENQGICVLAHPAAGRFRLKRWEALKPDAVEVLNASYPAEYLVRRGFELAEKLGLPQVGGSDSHHPQTVGDAYTVVDVSDQSVEEVVEAIRSGSTKYEGDLSPLLSRYRIGVGYLFQKFKEKVTRIL